MGEVNRELKLLIARLDMMDRPSGLPECDSLFTELVSRLGPYPPLAVLSDIVKHYQRTYDSIVATDIPCVLQEYGLSEAVMEDGTKVSVSDHYSVKTLDAQKVVAWLEANGMGDIVKDAVSLGKGGFNEELNEFLTSHGYTFTHDTKVEGQTLKKAIKDHLESGGDRPPEDAVQVSIFQSADIKRPKKEGF